jgi:hypothetical protein
VRLSSPEICDRRHVTVKFDGHYPALAEVGGCET